MDTLDVGTVDFDLDDTKKQALLHQGVKGAEEYFRWFEDPAESPVNRITTTPLGIPT